jgi:TolA-binding protein
MFKRMFVVCLVSLIGLVWGTVTNCFADTGDKLSQTKQNIFSLIDAGDFAKADSATKQLIADFSGSPGIDEVIHTIALKHQDAGNYQKEIELSRYVTANWPKSVHAVWAQMDIVVANLELGNETAAKAEIGNLKTNYKDDPNLPWTLNIVGITYMGGLGKYEVAKGVFEEVIEKYPQSPHANKSRMYLRGIEVLLLMKPNDYAAADAALDKLFANFAGHPDLPHTAKIIGERYYKDGLSRESEGFADKARDRFEKAVEIWDRVINGLPVSEIPEVRCWVGDYYYKLGKYEESMHRFQRVVDNHPDYEHAWRALFMVGLNYERMKDSGLIAKSEAQTKIRSVYEQLLQRSPNGRAAEYARTWLNEHNSN